MERVPLLRVDICECEQRALGADAGVKEGSGSECRARTCSAAIPFPQLNLPYSSPHPLHPPPATLLPLLPHGPLLLRSLAFFAIVEPRSAAPLVRASPRPRLSSALRRAPNVLRQSSPAP